MSEPVQTDRIPDVEVQGSSAELIDYELIREVLGFIGHSLHRHRKQILICGAVLLAIAGAISRLLPRTYHAESRIMTDRNPVIAALCNPARSMPREADQPTRGAYEMVMRKENLVSLVKRTQLVERSEALRTPMARLKDALMKKLGRQVPEDAKLDIMVDALEKGLSVNVNDGTVTIGLDWSDPQLTFDLIEAAQLSFIDARRKDEISSVQDAIAILETHEKRAAEDIKESIATLEKIVARLVAEKKKEMGDGRSLSVFALKDHHLAQIKFMVRAKRRSILDVEDFRRKRLTEMQAQLQEQRTIYSPEHPAILELKDRIEALKVDSPQLQSLKREEEELMGEYTRAGGRDIDAVIDPGEDADSERKMAGGILGTPDDPEAAVGTDNLRMVVAYHQEIIRRLNAARMELDIAQASFKHRYTVVNQPDYPSAPVKPKVTLIIVGGAVGGLVLGCFLALARDILTGKVLESWQIKRSLQLPVLAELEEST